MAISFLTFSVFILNLIRVCPNALFIEFYSISGCYWVFSIIITACYTGSIIAFVTLPVFPDFIETIDDLIMGFYRIGTLSSFRYRKKNLL